MSIDSEMPSNHLILCRPLLLLTSIFPSIRVFSSDAQSSLLRDWFPCAGAVLSLAQTHRGRPQTTSTRLYAGGLGTSLVVQWLRFSLPKQGAQV